MNSTIPSKDPLRRKAAPIRTNIMEILAELSSRTNDDHVVIAAMKNIFKSHQVRLANSLAPLRLVEAKTPTPKPRARNRRPVH